MNSIESGAAGSFSLEELPVELHANVLRHQKHLAQLVEGLRSVGVDEAVITASVDQLVETYRAELLNALRSLAKDKADA